MSLLYEDKITTQRSAVEAARQGRFRTAAVSRFVAEMATSTRSRDPHDTSPVRGHLAALS
jgi:hypothetical protein